MIDAGALEAFLLASIPIADAMGVQVDHATLKQVILSAPLLNNINHKKTVFGGSLHSVATLACWSLLHLHLAKEKAQLVIASSDTKYVAPVTGDFTAECHMPDMHVWERFLKTFQKKGKARIELHAKIYQEGKRCVDYTGIFAALKI